MGLGIHGMFVLTNSQGYVDFAAIAPRRRHPVTPTELAGTPLVSREEGSGTRHALTVALANALGAATAGIPVALVLSMTSAVRAAVVAGAGPAVLSELAVSDDLASDRLARVSLVGIDLRRTLPVWVGSRVPPAGAARDLLGHVTSPTHADRPAGPTPANHQRWGEAQRPVRGGGGLSRAMRICPGAVMKPGSGTHFVIGCCPVRSCWVEDSFA